MITKFNKYLITESPDNIKDENGNSHWYEHDEARPFFVEVNSNHTKVTNLYIGKNSTCHGEIKGYSNIAGKSYPGRIFIYNKLMAFWVYPNEILFDSIIENLEEQLDIQMFNNGWRIEVLKSDDGFIKKEFNPNDKDYYISNGVGLVKDKLLIPIEDYSGSDDVSEEEQIMHLMDWKEKDLAMKAGKFHFGNFGSIKTGWDTPHNIKYRQKIYQESKNDN